MENKLLLGKTIQLMEKKSLKREKNVINIKFMYLFVYFTKSLTIFPFIPECAQ